MVGLLAQPEKDSSDQTTATLEQLASACQRIVSRGQTNHENVEKLRNQCNVQVIQLQVCNTENLSLYKKKKLRRKCVELHDKERREGRLQGGFKPPLLLLCGAAVPSSTFWLVVRSLPSLFGWCRFPVLLLLGGAALLRWTGAAVSLSLWWCVPASKRKQNSTQLNSL